VKLAGNNLVLSLKSSPRYRWYILATASIGTFMSTLDSSILNVALPTISGKLDADLAILQWVVTAYFIDNLQFTPCFLGE